VRSVRERHEIYKEEEDGVCEEDSLSLDILCDEEGAGGPCGPRCRCELKTISQEERGEEEREERERRGEFTLQIMTMISADWRMRGRSAERTTEREGESKIEGEKKEREKRNQEEEGSSRLLRVFHRKKHLKRGNNERNPKNEKYSPENERIQSLSVEVMRCITCAKWSCEEEDEEATPHPHWQHPPHHLQDNEEEKDGNEKEKEREREREISRKRKEEKERSERVTCSCPQRMMKAYAMTMDRGPQKSGWATTERSIL
jgi:hypothetical protein